jgi:serine/threonine-protein kinase
VSPHDPDSAVGTVIAGRYRIGEQLGRGGFAVVHSGTCLATGQSVAIKLLHPRAAREPVAKARLEREGEVARRVRHPSVRTVLDAGTREDGAPYLVMDLLVGETLLERLARLRFLAIDEAIDVMTRVLDGLGAAHAQGILHRDVSPSNVFLTEDASVAKLFDFGMSKRMVAWPAENDSSILTTRGVVVGTLQYTAPEQVRGLRDLDARADIFSAGAVLYFALTGTRPFRGPDLREVLRAILAVDPPPPSHVRPGIPRELDAVLARALAKDREDRFQSARAMRQALLDLRRPVAVGSSAAEPFSQEISRPCLPEEDELTPLEVDLGGLALEPTNANACTRIYAPEVDALIDGIEGSIDGGDPLDDECSSAAE